MKKMTCYPFLLIMFFISRYTILAQTGNTSTAITSNDTTRTICLIVDDKVSQDIKVDYLNLAEKIFSFGNIQVSEKPVLTADVESRFVEINKRIDYLEDRLSGKTMIYEREGMLALGLIGAASFDLQKNREHSDVRNIFGGVFLGTGIVFELKWIDAMIFSAKRSIERDSLYQELLNMLQLQSKETPYDGLLRIRTVSQRPLYEKHDKGAIIFPSLNMKLHKIIDEDTYIEQLLSLLNDFKGPYPLFIALTDTDWKIRKIAARILGDQKTVEARTSLANLFHKEMIENVKEQAADALLKIHKGISLDEPKEELSLLRDVTEFKNKIKRHRREIQRVNESGGIGFCYGEFLPGSPNLFYNTESFPEITFHIYGFNRYDNPKMGMFSFSIGKHSFQGKSKFIIDGQRVDTTYTVSYSFMNIGVDLMYRKKYTYFWPFVGAGIVVPIFVEDHSIWGKANAGGLGVEFLTGLIIPVGRVSFHMIGRYVTKAWYYGKYHDPMQGAYWTESGWVDTQGFHFNLGMSMRMYK